MSVGVSKGVRSPLFASEIHQPFIVLPPLHIAGIEDRGSRKEPPSVIDGDDGQLGRLAIQGHLVAERGTWSCYDDGLTLKASQRGDRSVLRLDPGTKAARNNPVGDVVREVVRNAVDAIVVVD